MSRSMERVPQVVAGVNGLVSIFTVPPGHKYELLEFTVGSNTVAITGYGVLIVPSGEAPIFIDARSVEIPATNVLRLQFASWPLYAGDSLDVIALAGAAGDAQFNASIIDVDYSD